MAKIKFKLSIKEIAFEFEGDHETGQAISESMNHMMGSLAEAQSRVIDVTPKVDMASLPVANTPTPANRRKPRPKPKSQMNGEIFSPSVDPHPDGHASPSKTPKTRRAKSEGFRFQTYRLLGEGYFAERRTASEIQAEHARRGFSFNLKNVASELTDFTKKKYLERDYNEDRKFAYVKGPNDEFPRS